MSQEIIDESINAIFSPVVIGQEERQYSNALTAFRNLTGYFIEEQLSSVPGHCKEILDAVQFDFVGMMSMLKHFQRDAFGLKRFAEFTKKLVDQNTISKENANEIIEQASKLGLRVTTKEPRKTRIAATFTLWMCVFRPVSFDISKIKTFQTERLELFCARFNYWIASTYLSKFGDVILFDLPDWDVRYDRIKHDFTYREVSFSTLEALYCAYFKPDSTRDRPEGVGNE